MSLTILGIWLKSELPEYLKKLAQDREVCAIANQQDLLRHPDLAEKARLTDSDVAIICHENDVKLIPQLKGLREDDEHSDKFWVIWSQLTGISR